MGHDVRALDRRTCPRRPTAVIDAAGAPEVLPWALDALAPRGVFVAAAYGPVPERGPHARVAQGARHPRRPLRAPRGPGAGHRPRGQRCRPPPAGRACGRWRASTTRSRRCGTAAVPGQGGHRCRCLRRTAAAGDEPPIAVTIWGRSRASPRSMLRHAGASPEHAAIVIDHLVTAERMGLASHGLMRVPAVPRWRSGRA